MTVEEMDNMFEVLYNNITSAQAPGLNAYEKSVFLTKAQDEIVKNYFNPKSNGNLTKEGFDSNSKRQIDFSMLITVETITDENFLYKAMEDLKDGEGNTVYSRQNIVLTTPVTTYEKAVDAEGNEMKDSAGRPLYVARFHSEPSVFGASLFDGRDNTRSITLPKKLMIPINETVEVDRGESKVILQVVPIRFDEYTRLMSKPYKRPLKYQAWRLINSNKAGKADIIVGPSDKLRKYILRYIRRPKPIIISNLDGLTLEGEGDKTECELDPILHEEILQRAVELAKAAWTSTGQDNIQAVMQMGQRSE